MRHFSAFIDSFRPAAPPDVVVLNSTESQQGTRRLHTSSTKQLEKIDEEVTMSSCGEHVEWSEAGEHKTRTASTGGGLKRRLQSRHMQMIAFGGSIGTGLFIGTGGVLASGGPGFLVIDFLLVGLMLCCVVMSLGEMAAFLPVSGSFAAYSSRFLDPAWGFAMGYNYWMQWFVAFPLEIVAASIILTYWQGAGAVNKSVYVLIFLIVIAFINLFGVRGYGEFEFGASLIKITAVIGFIIVAIVIDTGGAPDGIYRGAETWRSPGAFNNGFKGFASVFVTATFAFAGTELIGLAAAESSNPRKEIPKAAKQVIWRILVFYVVSLMLIGLIVPYTEARLTDKISRYDSRASPFVIAITYGQIKVLPGIFNAIILVSVLSVGNSAVYGASRTLCGLAQAGQAPKLFTYIDREGRPLPAVLLSLLMGASAFSVTTTEPTYVLDWLVALSGLSSSITWGSLCACHIQFRRAWLYSGRTLEELPWKSPLGVAGASFGLVLNLLVVSLQFYIAAFPIGEERMSTSERVGHFFRKLLAVPVVLLFYAAWKIHTRCNIAKLEDMDLSTGRFQFVPVEILREERQAKRQKPVWKQVMAILF